MGKLNDKMTELADAIREKAFIVHIPGITDHLLSIDGMIKVIKDDLYSFQDVASLDAELSDVSIGKKFISYTGDVSTGTMPDTAAVLDGNTVTVPAGRIREEQTLTVSPGSVSIDGNKVTVAEGYVTGDTLTVSPGSVSIDGDKVNVSAGYVEDDTLTVPAGYVEVDESINKVIVLEGYVQADEIDLPGGFQLVKVTDYYPAREGFTAPGQIVISGMGEVTTEWEETYDFSDINGTYIITEDTKYRKGFDRVYKQVDGKYYIGGYNADAEEWSEFSNHWFISETKDGYGWDAKAYFNGDEIPSGTNNWYSDGIGEVTIPTEVTNTEVASLTETTLAHSITAFNAETSEWTDGDAVDISSYSLLPQTNGIYFAQGGKLIGQHIDRELHIPENGLVRRFKAVDGHFVDTVWGTEMMPYGDISFDEAGYCKNSAAPMAVKEGSYLSCLNTLTIPDNMTMVCFVKPYSGTGSLFGFGDKSDDQADIAFHTNGATFRGQIEQFDTGIAYGRWNVLVMTRIWDNSNRKVTAKLYTNGKPVHSIENESLMREHERSYIGVMADSAVCSSSGSVICQIDEACIWNRILTDEEISDMAKGLEGFDWDVAEKPYVQEQPVLYLSGANGRSAESGQLLLGDEESGGKFSDGAIYSYSEDTVYPNMYIPASSELFGSGDFSLCLDVMPIISRNSVVACPVINSGSNNPGFFLKQIDGKGEYHPGYYAGTELVCTSESVPLSEWTYIIITCEKGMLRMYKKGVLCMSQSITGSHVPFSSNMIILFREATYSYGFKGAIRNIRIYNRAITDEEIADLSGIKETE